MNVIRYGLLKQLLQKFWSLILNPEILISKSKYSEMI